MRLKVHPLSEEVARREEERVLERFDGIYSMHQAEQERVGPGTILYTPQTSLQAQYLPAANLKEGPANVVEIVHELVKAVPDGNHVPVLFAYKNGGVVTYILTAGYGTDGVHPVVVRKEYHTLAEPKKQASTPGDIKPWEIDL